MIKITDNKNYCDVYFEGTKRELLNELYYFFKHADDMLQNILGEKYEHKKRK